MDLLTHLFLPLALLYGAGMNGIRNRSLLLLGFFAVLPDADVFLGVHRGLFHSLLFVLPLTLVCYLSARKYFKYIALFISSHLLLDFITGGVPFLYPFVKLGIGMEFPLVLEFGSTLRVVEWLPRLVFSTPMVMHGQTVNVFSSFGIASLALFLIIYSKNKLRMGEE